MWQRGIALRFGASSRPKLGNEQLVSAPLRGPCPNWKRELVLGCVAWCVAPAQMRQRGIALSSGAWSRPKLGNEKLVSAPLRGRRPQIGNENLFLAVLHATWPRSKCGNEELLSAPALRPGPNMATRNWFPLRFVAPAPNWKRELVLSCVAWCVGRAQLWQRGIALSSSAWPRPKLGNEKCVSAPLRGPGHNLETRSCS